MLSVVTAADHPYWRCLWQLLLSAERRGAHRHHRFVAYDLGLGEEPLAELVRRFSWCEFRPFDFAAHPPHVAMRHRNLAWKPCIIDALLDETGGAVLWLDSATILKTDLRAVERQIRAEGVLALRGQSPLGARSHPATLGALGAPLEILDRPERAAGAVGFDPAHAAARRIVRDWRRWALRPEVIAPADPYFPGHRYDQAIVSALLLMAEFRGEITLTGDEIDISSAAPMRWMSSRNKLPPSFPRRLDRLARLYYAAWKLGDRRLIALERWKRTRLWGLERWWRESFTVSLADGAGREAALRPAGWCYYADPFLWRRDGRIFLFVEQFLYGANRGRIACLEIGDDLSAGPAAPVLDLGVHASFPFLFAYRDQLFMVPETCEARAVDLFVCERFPDRWRLARRLLYGLDAADSVLFPWQGRWWLLTSVRLEQGTGRHLEIHFTDDPLSGDWRAHPVNARRLYADAPHGSHRNAGAPLIEGDTLLRPVQMSRRHYGEGMAMMRIDRLTPEEFSESRIEHAVTDRLGGHHVSWAGGLMARDVRTRAR
jgi:hypothetical protein